MKKLLIITVLALTLILTGCDNRTIINEQFGFTVYMAEESACDTAEYGIYYNDDYYYYLPCLNSHWFTIEDEEGIQYTFEQFLSGGFLSIEDIHTLFDGEIHRYEFPYKYSDEGLNYLYYESQILNQEVETYYVYSFSPTCSHCNSIKLGMLEFIQTTENHTFYLVNRSNFHNDTSVDTVLGGSVPYLIKIENGIITETYSGSVQIPELIDTLN